MVVAAPIRGMSMPSQREADRRQRPERADAARNRRRVLAAAEELFARRDARNVTMEEIARTAGVGKGTLYRCYPDRASIAVDALLAPLAPEVYQYQRRARGRTPAEVTDALAHLAERVLGPPPAGVRS
jgi:AcrR family transcriptional regulator